MGDRQTSCGHLDVPTLEEYVRGECGDAAKATIEGHLAACAHCRKEVERRQEQEALARELRDLARSRGLGLQ